ncbi:hypothetical protein T484DRAFT_1616169, partial [Baffinella frigidus]
PGTRNPKPGTRNPEPETRNSEPGTQNPKPETRNPEPGTRNPKPETRNPKPQTPYYKPLDWSSRIPSTSSHGTPPHSRLEMGPFSNRASFTSEKKRCVVIFTQIGAFSHVAGGIPPAT